MRTRSATTIIAPARAARPCSAVAFALLVCAIWPASALAQPISDQQSSNWAGYADTADAPLRSVSARWVAPAASCDHPYASYSAFWVGLGGFKPSSQALEQIGTEADCTRGGRAAIYAWYELVPAAPVKLKLAVSAGDVLSAHASVHGDHVGLRIENLTTHHTSTKTVPMRSPDQSSAESIAEAPSECFSANQCRPLPLANFGTVSFTHARATTTRGRTGSITNPAFSTTKLTLSASGRVIGPGFVSNSSTGQATPSTTSQHGAAFGVSYQQTTSPTGPTPTAAFDQLRRSTPAPTHTTAQPRGVRVERR